MDLFIYTVFIRLYQLGIRMAARFNPKARLFVEGRKDIFKKLQKSRDPNSPYIWIHCASLGEFEQGRPVLEALKRKYPTYKVALSFFSPSGYEVRKNYTEADLGTYLPLDTKENASRFIQVINPELAIFVKYEYWFHYLNILHQRKTPLLLVSAIFRKEQPFFKPYGSLHRKMLGFFTRIFVQDSASGELLNGIALQNWELGGDTRFDRVSAIAGNIAPIPMVNRFCADRPVLVAGSTWPEDEQLLEVLKKPTFNNLKLIIAAHEIQEEKLLAIETGFPGSVRYSKAEESSIHAARVLIIDNIGMLARLYAYASIAYIGGGFNKSGMHNCLEAAVFGMPIVHGPNFEKFREARELVALGVNHPISTGEELEMLVGHWLQNESLRRDIADQSKHYVEGKKGATEKLLAFIQAKRLLTN